MLNKLIVTDSFIHPSVLLQDWHFSWCVSLILVNKLILLTDFPISERKKIDENLGYQKEPSGVNNILLSLASKQTVLNVVQFDRGFLHRFAFCLDSKLSTLKFWQNYYCKADKMFNAFFFAVKLLCFTIYPWCKHHPIFLNTFITDNHITI